MAFYISRSSNPNAVDVSGSIFTLGGTNSDLFTGDIEFINMPAVSITNILGITANRYANIAQDFYSSSGDVTRAFSDLTINEIQWHPLPAVKPSRPLNTGTTLISGTSANVSGSLGYSSRQCSVQRPVRILHFS